MSIKQPNPTRSFANEKELARMEKCHHGRLQLVKGIMQRVPDLKKDSALEVACGDGRLSKDLLS